MRLKEHVLKIIQFDSAISLFVENMKSGIGLNFLRDLSFCSDLKQLAARQNLLSEWSSFCDKEVIPWNNKVSCITSMIEDTKKSGMLYGEELIKVRDFLVLAMKLRSIINQSQKNYPAFSSLSRRMREFSSEIDSLKIIEDSGRLSDDASRDLRNIREKIEELRRGARRTVQRLLDDDKISSMLQERTTFFREGKILLLVRQENINRFPGTFVDRSSSGNSVYMEPHQLTSINNKISLLVRSEQDEERRILMDLTRQILLREGAIAEAESALGEIDLLCSADEVRRVHRWKIPELSNRTSFKFVNARHPLLKDRAVPVSIQCGGDFRQLIVTGPNTGGKTVVLKTAAVCLAIAYLGLPIPAEEGSAVGNIDEIFADIGDEQSIEQNLSTFSGHLKNIIEILKSAGNNSLVLFDELGAGTDPQEGAALGIAILEEIRLVNKSLVVANTHHNPIKQYALTAKGVETASMEFDTATLSPTYRLLMGVPGRSNALHIAKIYGMNDGIIARAQEALKDREANSEELISRINERGRFLDLRERELAQKERQTEKMKNEYRDRLSEIERRRDEIFSAAEERAAKIISDADQKSKAMIRGVDGALKSAAHREIHTNHEDVEKLRRMIDNHRKKRAARAAEALQPPSFEPNEGMTVQVIDTGMVGVIERIKNGRARLIAGPMKLDVPVEKLGETNRKAKVAIPSIDTTVPIRVESVPSSIMVRGMNVDEALPMVAQYLDRAMRVGHTSVLVIHGRGEGILRREVHALCSSLKYVESYRLGEASEGGYGVTVVSFKR